MSDASVAEALRSSCRRVVVQAPAGTGKTHQAAAYAHHAVDGLDKGQRVLVLAHTHSACDVFSARTSELHGRVQIGTIDSLIAVIAKAYHRALDLPADVHGWLIDSGADCYSDLARRVRVLLDRSPAIAGALAERYPIVICDEHQDASDDQHKIADALAREGARLRFFGDPMQAIFSTQVRQKQWQGLADAADACEKLETAHRWASGSRALGEWILEQRERLLAGQPVHLGVTLPNGLTVIRADNNAPRYGQYQLDTVSRRLINKLVSNSSELLILTPHTSAVFALNTFFGWRIPIWEGHTRDALNTLLSACRRSTGNPVALGQAMCSFLEAIGKGFSASAYGNRLIEELKAGCVKPCRGKPAEIQSIARVLLQNPTHIGVGSALDLIHHLMRTSESFSDIRIDLPKEFAESRQIHMSPETGTAHARLTQQRKAQTHRVPPQAISTVHKSKGLETRRTLLLPCDAKNLVANQQNRCLLYVALSRASEAVTVVVPNTIPSPLFDMG